MHPYLSLDITTATDVMLPSSCWVNICVTNMERGIGKCNVSIATDNEGYLNVVQTTTQKALISLSILVRRIYKRQENLKKILDWDRD